MRSINQSFSVTYQYTVTFTKGIFHVDNPLFAALFPKSPLIPKLLVVLDQGVAAAHPDLVAQIAQYGEKYQKQFKIAGPVVTIPGGEQCKNDQMHLERILAAINEHNIDRHSYVIIIGGGAVLDVAGYAASIGHRGIRQVRIPTTVLAQNDSGVGVKNGVNAFGKKNFLGSFSPPVAVVNDQSFLTTLDIRDWRSGIAEAIKVGLIKDRALFDFIKQSVTQLVQRDAETMDKLIHQCAELHVQHIASGDPFEQGSSRPLDFGHWAAHKLEQLSNYQLRHGEAVALGIALDCTYSYLIDKLSEENLIDILCLLREIGFDLYTDLFEEDTLLQGLKEFQEHLGGELTITLLDDIGCGTEVHHMDTEIIRKSIKLLYRYHHHNSLSA